MNTNTSLQALQDDFVAALPDLREHLTALLGAFTAVADTANDSTELHYELRGLIASAASFGLPLLSEQSRAVSLWLDVCASGASSGRQESIGNLNAAFEELFRIMAKPELPLPIAPISFRAKPAGEVLVLVVDENERFLDQIGSQLRHYGFKVTCIPLAEFSPDVLSVLSPALLLADAVIANTFQQQLSDYTNSADAASCEYMFMSDDMSFESRLAAARVGDATCFAKPVDFSTVVDAISRLSGAATDQYRVLLVSANDSLVGFSRAVLKAAGLDVEVASDALKLPGLLEAFDPDAVVMDVEVPEYSAIELARLIRQEPENAALPIVFISTESEVDARLLTMSRAEDGFLTTPLVPARLLKSVQSRCDRARKQREVELFDGLTGLLQHSEFCERLERTIARSERNGAAFSLCLIDIDKLRLINDQHGHRSGDRVLKSLAFMLMHHLRRPDVCGRYSSEVLAVVLPDIGGSRAKFLIDELCNAFGKLLFQFDEQLLSATFSAGITTFHNGVASAELLQAATESLKDAKQAGGNCVLVHGYRKPERTRAET